MKKEDAFTALGFALPLLLTLVLLIFKMRGASISWWGVTSPIWITAIAWLILVIVYMVAFSISYYRYKRSRNKKQ